MLLINGKAQTPEPMPQNLKQLIDQYGLAGKRLIIEHNGQVILPERWAETPIKDGDQIELIQLVGGG